MKKTQREDCLKTCTKCDKSKPYTEFYKNKNYKDGWTTQCKECSREYQKLYYLNNKEKWIKWQDMTEEQKRKRKKWQDMTEEQKRKRYEYILDWQAKNWEKVREYRRKIQCEDCLKFFKKKDIEEIAATGEKLCKECFERRKRFNHLEDSYPFP